MKPSTGTPSFIRMLRNFILCCCLSGPPPPTHCEPDHGTTVSHSPSDSRHPNAPSGTRDEAVRSIQFFLESAAIRERSINHHCETTFHTSETHHPVRHVFRCPECRQVVIGECEFILHFSQHFNC